MQMKGMIKNEFLEAYLDLAIGVDLRCLNVSER